MRKKLLPLILILLVALPFMALAQPGFGDDVDDVPLDGGLSLLIAAGSAYGIKKLRQANRKAPNDNPVQ